MSKGICAYSVVFFNFAIAAVMLALCISVSERDASAPKQTEYFGIISGILQLIYTIEAVVHLATGKNERLAHLKSLLYVAFVTQIIELGSCGNVVRYQCPVSPIQECSRHWKALVSFSTINLVSLIALCIVNCTTAHGCCKSACAKKCKKEEAPAAEAAPAPVDV